MKKISQMFVEDYLAGNKTLDQVQELFIDITWGERAASDEERALVEQLELCIAEFTSGHSSEEELRRELQDTAGISAAAVVALSQTPSPLEYRSSSAITRRSAAFG